MSSNETYHEYDGPRKNVAKAANAIDAQVSELINRNQEGSGGFVLNLANQLSDDGDREVSIRVEKPVNEADTYLRPTDLRSHHLDDTASFIAYSTAFGDPINSVIFYHDLACVLILNEITQGPKSGSFGFGGPVCHAQREQCRLEFERADDFKEWFGVIDTPKSHRDLLTFLQNHTHNLEDRDILQGMQHLRLTSNTEFVSEVEARGDNIQGFQIKVNGREALAKFPEEFRVKLPILVDDETDEDQWDLFTLRLRIDLPADGSRSPAFTLYCSDMKHTVRKRIAEEIGEIRKALGEDWRIYRGIPSYRRVEMGTGS